jgi:hypothetical protein
MTTLHTAKATTDAIVHALESGGLTVGDGEKPDGAGWQGTPGQSTFTPYVVVVSFGGMSGGTIRHPDSDTEAIYQLSSVGATRSQAELVADEARTVMLEWPWTVAGRAIQLVRVDAYGGAFREDLGAPPLWSVPDRYRVFTTPG